MDENLTYETAYQELEQIYYQINNEQVTIDELASKVKRASLLVSFCQEKLRNTEAEIGNIIAGMDGRDTRVNPAEEAGSAERSPFNGDDELPF